MKILQKLFAIPALLVLACSAAFAQQNLLTQTTLSAAIAGSLLGQGVSSTTNPPPQLVQVASATGIVGLNPNLGVTASQPTQSAIYVDRELMLVTAVNGTTLTVVRGYAGTVAAPHASGTMVLSGAPRFFYPNDPGGITASSGTVSDVACTAANVVVSPWLNYRSGAQWICSSITGTWVPGWNNFATPRQTATVASAAGAITPSGPYFQVSGVLAVTGFNIPLGFNGTGVGGGCFTVNPTGIWTWTAAGNIAIAGTTTQALVSVTFCWNASTSKWIPSKIA